MANQLRWQPVDIPRLDTRDLAIAGDTINNSMDRFAALLAQRDARLNKQATDAAATQVLAANDPTAVQRLLQQAAAGQLGDRVDARTIAALGTERTGQLTDQALARSNLSVNESKQAKLLDMQKFQPLYSGIDSALRNGNVDEARRLQTQLESQGGGLNLYDVLQTGGENLTEYQQYQDTLKQRGIENDFTRQELAIRRAAASQTNRTRQDQMTGAALAKEWSKKAGSQTTSSGLNNAMKDPVVQALGPEGLKTFRDQFTLIHDAAIGLTDEITEKTRGQSADITKAAKAIEATQRRVAAENDTELARDAAVARTVDPKNPISRQTVFDAFSANSPNALDYSDKTEFDKILAEATLPNGGKPTLAAINRAIESVPSQGQWWNRLGSVAGTAAAVLSDGISPVPRSVRERFLPSLTGGAEATDVSLDKALSQEQREGLSYPAQVARRALEIQQQNNKTGGRSPQELAQAATAPATATLARVQSLFAEQQRAAAAGVPFAPEKSAELLRLNATLEGFSAGGVSTPTGSRSGRSAPSSSPRRASSSTQGFTTPAGDFMETPGLSAAETGQLQQLMAKNTTTPAETARIAALWDKVEKARK